MFFLSSVFALTQLHKTWDKKNWIRTSENYERMCLNKKKFSSKFGFGASR
jgi:hypothetical protein